MKQTMIYGWRYEMVVCVWQWLIDCLHVCERTNDEVQFISNGVGGCSDILAEAILLQEAVKHHSVSSLTEVSKQDQIG